jgi:hypothetical protein
MGVPVPGRNRCGRRGQRCARLARYRLRRLQHCRYHGFVSDFRQTDQTQRIAELNDLARKAMGIACRLVQTEGISALPSEDQSAIREKVETFSDFTPGSDPHGERDFETFGQRIFWKIDYYAPGLTRGSEEPADPAQTVRVLTIMLASEY